MQENCVDTDEDTTDINENGCKDYLPSWCGKYDDIGFISSQICCACGGGNGKNNFGRKFCNIYF